MAKSRFNQIGYDEFYASRPTSDECIQNMRDALAKAKRLAALFPNGELPQWFWTIKNRQEGHDRMLAHGFKLNLITGEYEKA